jgi:hypothetical protein
MGQRSLDACGVSVAKIVQRLNKRIGIAAQLRYDGVRLVDKLDDRSPHQHRCAGSRRR